MAWLRSGGYRRSPLPSRNSVAISRIATSSSGPLASMRTVTPIDAVRSITATMFLALMRRPFATREILHRQRSAMRTIRAHVSACSPRGLGMTRCQVRIQVLICSRMGKFPARPREVQPMSSVAPHHQMVRSATRVQPAPPPREALRQSNRHTGSTQVPRGLGRHSLAVTSLCR